MTAEGRIRKTISSNDDCPSLYYEEITAFKSWCDGHHLILNTNETKEMLFDPRELRSHDTIFIHNCAIEQVCSYTYLSVIMDRKLKWCECVEYFCKKLAQRVHFLRMLRLF